MDKAQDVSVPNNCTVNDDDEEDETPRHSQKIVELTENEIKKFGVQNIENSSTIKMLKRELSQSRRDCLFTKKKLEDAQKQADAQSENKNQLLQDNKKQVENFNKLKEFQLESTIKNISNNEKTFTFGKNKNDELAKKFILIKEKENSSKILNEEIFNKKTKLNNDIQCQVEHRRSVNNEHAKVLIQLKNKIEQHKVQLNEPNDNHLKDLVDKNEERIIRLTADLEAYQNRNKQEIDNLMREKSNKLQDIKDNTKRAEEIKELLLKLQSELISLENNQSIYNEKLEKTKTKEVIVQELIKKREIIALSEKSLNENVENLRNQQEKINNELDTKKIEFAKKEDTLRKEFDELLAKVEEKKRLLKTCENYNNELIKLRETKLAKHKEYSEKDMQEKFKKSKDELKKCENIITISDKKKKDLNAKLKELQNKRDSLEKKLEDNAMNVKETNETKSNIEPEVPEYTYNKPGSTDGNSEKQQPKTTNPVTSPDRKSAYSFDISDSDSEEDEFKIVNLQPKKNDNQLKNDTVFDRTMSQKPSSSTKDSKDMDVFKVPRVYATPMRRKPNQQSKKY